MHDLLWKNDIVKQVKNQEIMTAAWANVVLIHATDAAIKACETVHNQNIKFYNNDNNSDNTDEKYVNLNSYNLLDMLAALMKMWDKLQSNMKNKNKKVTQEQIEKKKWYSVSRILCQEEYLDASQQKSLT